MMSLRESYGRRGVVATLVACVIAGGMAFAMSDASDALAVTQAGATAQQAKDSVPTVTKEVSLDGKEWDKVVDASSSKPLYYRVTGTMPSYTEPYDKYPYSFVDKHEKGILVEEDSIQVSRIHDGQETDVTDEAAIEVSDGTLTVAFSDLKSTFPDMGAEDTLVLTYRDTLSQVPDLGLGNPNENECHLLYMSDEQPDKEDHSYGMGSMEQTPSVVTFVYSYAIGIDKVSAGRETPLAGARFSVRDDQNQWMCQGGWMPEPARPLEFVTDEQGKASIGGLGTGRFTLVEMQAPRGYATVGPIEFEIRRETDDSGRPSLSLKADGVTVEKVDPQGGTLSMRIKDPVSGRLTDAIATSLAQLGADLPVIGATVTGLVAMLALAYARSRRNGR
jgi:fimbrial isopeptide formation D2 family protein